MHSLSTEPHVQSLFPASGILVFCLLLAVTDKLPFHRGTLVRHQLYKSLDQNGLCTHFQIALLNQNLEIATESMFSPLVCKKTGIHFYFKA